MSFIDVIFALATPPGRSAVAVIRLSGAGTAEALGKLAGALPPPRRAALRRLRDPHTDETLDKALVFWTPGPTSYTGEDSGELHLHGGLAVIDAVSAALVALGVRPALPGEFTRRAFENGRLDLTEVEAVADLIEAETEGQRRQALAQLDGALAQIAAGWREALLETLALLEAAVDFPDEDLPLAVTDGCQAELSKVAADLRQASSSLHGERVRQGFRVALVGAPNAGKSSLFNALLGRDAAIVSPTAGTTRDVIEGVLILKSQKVILADTAGVREAVDSDIERQGAARALAWAKAADLRLIVRDPLDCKKDTDFTDLVQDHDIQILTKAEISLAGEDDGLRVSSLTGSGVDDLRFRIAERASAAICGEAQGATRERHRLLFAQAASHLDRAIVILPSSAELAAEDVRLAARELERLTGKLDTEEVLGRIFSTFCIGK